MDHTKRDDHIDVTFSSPEPNASAGGPNAPTTTVDASRLRTLSETEVRLTREITSVMMTTSGFLSPAREGKLPDAKTPIIQSQFDPPAAKASATSGVSGLPGVIAAAVAQSQAAGKDAVMVPDGGVLPGSQCATPSISDRPEKGGKKKANDKKIAKDLFKSKTGSPMVAPMGPPPPKQMPSMVEPLYPPSNSPMAAVVQQQHILAMSPLVCGDAGAMASSVPAPKPGKKHKHKDPNKTLNKSADGTKLSKKKQKKQAEKMLAQAGGNIAGSVIGAPQPMWDNKSFPGIDPIHGAALPYGQQPPQMFTSPGISGEPLSIKTERPHTPDQPQMDQPMLGHLPEPIGQMSPIFNMLPAGTTGTPILHSPLPVTPTNIGTAGPSGFDGGKLVGNPDKRKQNILKRISKKDADLKALLPPNLNLPEMSIFPIIEDNMVGVGMPQRNDQPLNMSMPKTSPGFGQSPMGLVSPVPSLVALSPGFSPQQHQSHMSMMMSSPQQQQHKPMLMQPNVTASGGKAKKEPKPKKVREKKPPKPRAKKAKAGMPPDWPAGMPPPPPQHGLDQPMHPPPLSPFGGAGGPANMLPSPPPPQHQPQTAAAAAAQKQRSKLAGHLPPTLGNIDDALNQFGPAAAMQRPDFMFPWPFSGGPSGLMPGMPGMPPGVGVASGPGLIPGMPGSVGGLIPGFPPFPPMPGNMPMPGNFLVGHGPPFDATGKPVHTSADMVPFGFQNMVGTGSSSSSAVVGELPRQKRSRVDDSNAPVAPPSAVCNVAPLVPSSLKLDAAAQRAAPIVDDDDDDDLQFVSTTPAPIAQQLQQRTETKMSIPSTMQMDAIKSIESPAPTLPSPLPSTGGAASAAAQSSSKRRRSPSPPQQITPQPPAEPLLPKLSGPPPIIDLDVQSISDDELPFDDDDMDLEELTPSAADATTMPPLSKKDKSLLKLERKKEKELRKEGKKDKEGKIKKKKDKKDKSKGKEKSEKRKEKEDKRRDKELKDKAKKEKKEKKRALLAQQADVVDGSSSMDDSGPTRPGFGGNVGIGSGVSTMEHTEGAVPKLTLKLGASPRPNTPDAHRKM